MMDDLELDAEEITSSGDDDSDDDGGGTGYTVIDMGSGGTQWFSGDEGIIVTGGAGNILLGNNISTVVGTHQPHTSREKRGSDSRHSNHTTTVTESKAPPSRKDLDFVCSNIGKRWKRLGYSLGLSRGQVATIETDFHVEGVYEMCWQTLLKWTRSHGDDARICDLAKAVRDIGMTELAMLLPVK